jgi:predicted metal-dependent enzyme (double-stranded beta helix superfamily)
VGVPLDIEGPGRPGGRPSGNGIAQQDRHAPPCGSDVLACWQPIRYQVDRITSLSLIDVTHPAAGRASLAQVVRSLAASPQRWAGLVRYRSGERWYQRLDQAESHELWLLSWLPGQRTGFHDHFGSAGAFAVVSGELQEHTVIAARAAGRGIAPAADARVAVATFATGQVRAFGPRHVHEVVNGSAEPAVSIHAYSPSLAGMRRYELTPAGLVLAAVEMAEEDW